MNKVQCISTDRKGSTQKAREESEKVTFHLHVNGCIGSVLEQGSGTGTPEKITGVRRAT